MPNKEAKVVVRNLFDNGKLVDVDDADLLYKAELYIREGGSMPTSDLKNSFVNKMMYNYGFTKTKRSRKSEELREVLSGVFDEAIQQMRGGDTQTNEGIKNILEKNEALI